MFRLYQAKIIFQVVFTLYVNFYNNNVNFALFHNENTSNNTKSIKKPRDISWSKLLNFSLLTFNLIQYQLNKRMNRQGVL